MLTIITALVMAGCQAEPPVGNDQREPNLAAAPKPARAITASFDCDRARGQAQELICGDAALALMDREVARLSGQSDEVASQAHVEWMQERDSCDKADELRQCVMAAAMLKIHRLRKMSGSVPAGDGPTVGPVAFICGGLAGEVEATFVNSEPGAVALEWDGQAIAIDQVIAASGAKYEGRWNGQPYIFWNKGREATFTVPGKGDLQCEEKPVAA
ncbi:MAG: MliC family protein [Pseudomonadota bacterium]